MKQVIAILILAIALFSCHNTEVKKEFYKNGRVKVEAHYRNGKLDGDSKEYSEGGSLLNRKHWINGAKDTFDYYKQGKVVIRAIYNVNGKTKEVCIMNYDSGKFIPFKKNDVLAYVYSYNDTIKVGEKFVGEILLISPNPDSLKNINVYAGSEGSSDTICNIDTVELVKDVFLTHAKYTAIGKKAGTYELVGLVRCVLPGRKEINSYPFRYPYYIKEK